ncbi:hypothetical protein [Streptomyces griseomycini]|uniref:Uncharacterized protein n=1 Tax=Streptomyces griseomycini TaxID=66895 RepID=A0A7W7PY29_9ACTN|nr:hypothetical protein [Streptomyces griseomycini]MBB4903308.1 hypothetical protein [Streptomyces griseomycini]GGR43595.1 hypothetical protein GCM10015536_56940 [Streptomyces griseomycini]
MPSIIAPAVAAAEKKPLPMRPTPHERDGRQPCPDPGRPHAQTHHTPTAEPDSMILEALRRVIDEQIGPRSVGAIYSNTDGAFEVLTVVRDPAQARALLRRRCAQWALIVQDVLRPGAKPFAIGSVWTTSDVLLRPDVDEARRRVQQGGRGGGTR